MKVKNTSNKIIGIGGGMVVLPDEIKELPEGFENNSSIKAYIEIGFLKALKSAVRVEKIEDVIDEPEEVYEEAEEIVDEVVEEAPAEDKPVEEKKAKKGKKK